MAIPPTPPKWPLPANWPDKVKKAMLPTIFLETMAMTYSRAWCANSPLARVRLQVERDAANEEIALLREEIRIKNAHLAAIEPRLRPQYPPTERMAILELKTRRGWSNAQTARVFQVTDRTIGSWFKRVDEPGPNAQVQVPVPVNKFPDLVRYTVQRLKTLCPLMGKKKVAGTLARAGLHLGITTVGRMRKEPPVPPPAVESAKSVEVESPAEQPIRNLKSKYPDHIWNLDLTVVPTLLGFWIPILPFALVQRWPFCWWVVVAKDHFSRRIMGMDVLRVFQNRPVAATGRPGDSGKAHRRFRRPGHRAMPKHRERRRNAARMARTARSAGWGSPLQPFYRLPHPRGRGMVLKHSLTRLSRRRDEWKRS